MRFKFLVFTTSFIFFASWIYAATETASDDTTDDAEQKQRDMVPKVISSNFGADAQLAMSSPYYKVTAGDVYILTYSGGTNIKGTVSEPIEYTISIDISYKARILNFGIINAAGKTYREFKDQVEGIVLNNYPLSAAQLTMSSPGTFQVYVNGEIESTCSMRAWALTSLADVLANGSLILTNYSSIRDVTIRNTSGSEKQYDIFKWMRYGDETQNPYVRSGDTIIVHRAKRRVSITGSVERPDNYQLLESENLKKLLEFYAGGFDINADRTKIELTRAGEGNALGAKMFINMDDIQDDDFQLCDYDLIYVPSKEDSPPTMFVEGAINPVEGSVKGVSSPSVSSRLPVSFTMGETYYSIVHRYSYWFSEVSDIKNAYISRGGSHIPLNIYNMLYDASSASQNNLAVEPNDTLMVPFRQYFVSVAGAVLAPGKYPYIPDRTWDYYIGLAGGLNKDANSFEAVTIVNPEGSKLTKKDFIEPETIITAKTNSFLYYFNKYTPIFFTVASLISTTLSMYTVLRAYK